MTCKAVQSRLSAYLDRELSGNEMLAIRSHLSECASCETEFRELRTLKSLLAATPSAEPSADFAARLTQAILTEKAPQPQPRRWIRVGTFAGVAACSMALTYFAIMIARPVTSSGTQASNGSQEGIALQIRRDQMYSTSLDATTGAPLISMASNGR